MKLAWATDIHLNFVTTLARRRFLESIKEQADALVVTGDIAESNRLAETLMVMDVLVERPVYFVLGNHDFLLIEELRCWRDTYTLEKPALRRKLEALGDEAAAHVQNVLTSAAEYGKPAVQQVIEVG